MGKADLNTNQVWAKLDAMDGADGKITKKIWNAFAAIAGGKTINYYITEDAAKRSIGYYLANASEEKFQMIDDFIKNSCVNSTSENNSKSENNATNYQDAQKYRTKINGEIERSMQGDYAADCWFLTVINGLNNTKWGKKAIKNAIKPDSKGGAIVTLNMPDGKKKEYHISYTELINKGKSSKYASGDYDMIALEIACTRYYEETKNRNLDGGSTHDVNTVVKLFCGNARTNTLTEIDNNLKNVEEMMMNNPDSIVNISFIADADGLYAHHSYLLEKIETDSKGNKIAVLINPWDSGKRERYPWDRIKWLAYKFDITEGPNTNSHKYDSNNKKRHDETQGYYKRVLHENSYGTPSERQKQDYKSLNSDNIMYFLKDKDTLKKIISKADKQTLGYSKSARKNKIALIKPIVDSLCQRAIDFKIDKKYVENVRKICYEEINATFYTDAKKIGKVLCELFDKIQQKGG